MFIASAPEELARPLQWKLAYVVVEIYRAQVVLIQ